MSVILIASRMCKSNTSGAHLRDDCLVPPRKIDFSVEQYICAVSLQVRVVSSVETRRKLSTFYLGAATSIPMRSFGLLTPPDWFGLWTV
jgi:hypothetical protein